MRFCGKGMRRSSSPSVLAASVSKRAIYHMVLEGNFGLAGPRLSVSVPLLRAPLPQLLLMLSSMPGRCALTLSSIISACNSNDQSKVSFLMRSIQSLPHRQLCQSLLSPQSLQKSTPSGPFKTQMQLPPVARKPLVLLKQSSMW